MALKSVKVAGGWRRLHHSRSFVICTLHQNIIRVIISRRIRLLLHAACMGEMHTKF